MLFIQGGEADAAAGGRAGRAEGKRGFFRQKIPGPNLTNVFCKAIFCSVFSDFEAGVYEEQ